VVADEDDGARSDPASRLPSDVRRRARRLAWLYLAAGIVLIPWIVYLALTLPAHDLDRHYRLTWVGFDIVLVIVIVRTAYMAFKVDPRVQFAAAATAVLLFVDAWFDVTTAGSRAEVMEAVVLALLIEIPAAIFSLVTAHRVNRRAAQLAAHAGAIEEYQREHETPPH
jgi:hypothetical protein